MESLAYLYLVLAHEDPTEREVILTLENIKLLQWLQQPKILSQGRIACLSLLLILASMSIPVKGYAQSVGARGDNVAEIQRCLASLGYFNANRYGYYGPITKTAVEGFQRDYGLTVDGVVGRSTRPALFRACGRNNQTSQPTRQVSHLAPQSTSSGRRNLRRGRTGEDVRQVQQCLRDLGYSVGVDGIFGSRMETEVKRFQSRYGLAPDGEVGSRTYSVLDRQCNSNGGTRSTTFFSDSFSGGLLRLGSTDPEVETIQNCLRELGDFQGQPTGYFDEELRAAVIRFQRKNGLSVDGVVGNQTRNVLYSQCGISPGVPGQEFFPQTTESPARDYVVVVPIRGNDTFDDTLFKVRQYVPDAFKADSRLGEYVQAGAFENYNSAESTSRNLRAKGFDARVVHRPPIK